VELRVGQFQDKGAHGLLPLLSFYPRFDEEHTSHLRIMRWGIFPGSFSRYDDRGTSAWEDAERRASGATNGRSDAGARRLLVVACRPMLGTRSAREPLQGASAHACPKRGTLGWHGLLGCLFR
jgi:hypothetical protein